MGEFELYSPQLTANANGHGSIVVNSAEFYMKHHRFEEADDERDADLSQSYEGTGDDTEV